MTLDYSCTCRAAAHGRPKPDRLTEPLRVHVRPQGRVHEQRQLKADPRFFRGTLFGNVIRPHLITPSQLRSAEGRQQHAPHFAGL